MKVKIRKGDTVEVISGRLEDKGKRGEVINVFIDDRRVVVQGVNIRTKHQKQVQTQAGRNINPGRIQFERQQRLLRTCPTFEEVHAPRLEAALRRRLNSSVPRRMR